MPPVEVTHALGSYKVYVEPGILGRLPDLLRETWSSRPVVLISDDIVAGHYDEWTRDVRFKAEARLTFPPGEKSKTRETWQRLSDEMLGLGFGRDSAIVAVGGGVVGDLAGFVAATYLRGIPYAQVPTTLLAMLDASVGGKVGVDTPHGKNLVGAFHPPSIVVADPATLASLPERDYRDGFAEAVKHGLIADADYFQWLEHNVALLRARSETVLTHLVRRSVEIKAQVVSADERETGQRAILNAGHSIAHGLETESSYILPHGEAVALGLVTETRIAERMGIAQAGLADRVAALIAALGLPHNLGRGFDHTRVIAAMRHDKKNRGGNLRLALPQALGRMHSVDGGWTVPVAPSLIGEVLNGLA